MKPIKFEQANKNLLKPESMTDEECSSLLGTTMVESVSVVGGSHGKRESRLCCSGGFGFPFSAEGRNLLCGLPVAKLYS